LHVAALRVGEVSGSDWRSGVCAEAPIAQTNIWNAIVQRRCSFIGPLNHASERVFQLAFVAVTTATDDGVAIPRMGSDCVPPVNPPLVPPVFPPLADPLPALDVLFDPPQPAKRLSAAAMDAARVIVFNIVECPCAPGLMLHENPRQALRRQVDIRINSTRAGATGRSRDLIDARQPIAQCVRRQFQRG